jgi:hypothetical protein
MQLMDFLPVTAEACAIQIDANLAPGPKLDNKLWIAP